MTVGRSGTAKFAKLSGSPQEFRQDWVRAEPDIQDVWKVSLEAGSPQAVWATPCLVPFFRWMKRTDSSTTRTMS